MADKNSLERCLTSLKKTLNSRTGLPLLTQYINETYSGSEQGDYILIVEFLEACQLILSADKLRDADKFANAKKLAEEEENRVRHKINMNAHQSKIMQRSDDILELETTVKAVFDRNTAEDSSLHRVFIDFREDTLTRHSLCGQPKPAKKKKDSCDLS